MPTSVILLSDGTNNSPSHPATNIHHLWRLTSNVSPEQLSIYDSGIGTAPSPSAKTPIAKTLSRWAGLAFGTSLEDNVLDLYLHLVRHYDEAAGTQVYLFGFSRGAYTVRILAGLLHLAGLLRPEHVGHARDVLRAYGQLYRRADWRTLVDAKLAQADYAALRRDLSRPCPIRFMGLFDTVSSVGWVWNPKTFPNTYRLPNVRTVRHALALDERRAKFRTNRVSPAGAADLQERWFAGVHSDVGGGYPEGENTLSRVPLRWMLDEARAAGLRINADVARELGLDRPDPDEIHAPQHESLRAWWWLLEAFPVAHRYQASDGSWVAQLRCYLGRGWRTLTASDIMHPSVHTRRIPVHNPARHAHR